MTINVEDMADDNLDSRVRVVFIIYENIVTCFGYVQVIARLNSELRDSIEQSFSTAVPRPGTGT
jgi:hypothetical protein